MTACRSVPWAPELAAARLARQEGRAADAEVIYRNIVSATAPLDARSLTLLFELAEVHGESANDDGAEEMYRHALQIYQRRGESQQPDVAIVLLNIVPIIGRRGQYAEGEALSREALGYGLQIASVTAIVLMAPGDVLLLLLERFLKSEYLVFFGPL